MWNVNVPDSIKVFELKQGVREKILENYETSEEKISENVTDIKKWVETRKHLPVEAQDKIFIEVVLLKNKFNVERTKDMIEKYFKTVQSFPKVFTNLGQFKASQEVCTSLVLPTLTPSNERINVLKVNVNATADYDVTRCFNSAITVASIGYHYDRIDKYRFLIDFADFKFYHLIKIAPSVPLNLYKIFENMLKIRVVGIEIINAPRFWKFLWSWFKAIVKPKLLARVTVHDDLDSLYVNVPRECLPQEYGGYSKNLEYHLKIHDDLIEDLWELFEKLAGFTSHQQDHKEEC